MIGVGATLNERFLLEEVLGEGGMGTVFRAADKVLGRDVAIKLLKESGSGKVAQKIQLEAQILARLVHERIVRLYDLSESQGNQFLVMEEVNGPSFSKRWRELTLENRLRICGQVADALDYAHFEGVIHRDVKPGNVLLTQSDDAKLSDFGLSLLTEKRKDHSGTVRGTPYYMSPEQAQGLTLDHRTDLYSVGVMLYECATGSVPFSGPVMSVIAQHINALPEQPRRRNPDISSNLENLILSLLEKNPAKRPVSGKAVARSLAEESERISRLGRSKPPSSTGLNSPSDSAKDSALPEISAISETPTIPPSPEAKSKSQSKRAAGEGSHAHPVAREMLLETLAEPIVISPEERYLCGHYLAYLLGGSQRRGLFLRRPLDVWNANRARVLLAMTWLSCIKPTEESIKRASILLEERPDVRAALSPIVVVKYLAARDTRAKRKRFRQIRAKLQEASPYARKTMLDNRGVLNPGMMPRTLEDLEIIAPPRERLDAHRVSLWNRLAEVWRENDDFRSAVLGYATQSGGLDNVSADLWPEIVYPLIERAHWQRTFRPKHEALWDYVIGKVLRVPVPGVRLDKMMIIAVPRDIAEQLDEDLITYVDDPQFDGEDNPAATRAGGEPRPVYYGSTIPRDDPASDEDDDASMVKVIVPLATAEPYLFTQETLRELWEEAVDAKENPRPGLLQRTLPIGPYRLAVLPTGRQRTRATVTVVLRGLHLGKEIEFLTPAIHAKGAASKTVIAIWIYQDGSMAVIHFDFQHKERYTLWHTPKAHQFNYGNIEDLRYMLTTAGMEMPERLGDILSSGKKRTFQ